MREKDLARNANKGLTAEGEDRQSTQKDQCSSAHRKRGGGEAAGAEGEEKKKRHLELDFSTRLKAKRKKLRGAHRASGKVQIRKGRKSTRKHWRKINASLENWRGK
jgi:hypothetical protein